MVHIHSTRSGRVLPICKTRLLTHHDDMRPRQPPDMTSQTAALSATARPRDWGRRSDSNSFTDVKLQSRFLRRRRRRVSDAAQLNGLARTSTATQSLIESNDVINWLKLINGIPLVFAAALSRCVRLRAAARPSVAEGSAAVRAAGLTALISPGAGFIKSRRYQRLPRTNAARPDLMRRWAAR